ncbi:hypothetical protein [Mobiluncus curtisii]|uniref:hypothetical protein n=1 Tax=Mobiluncus curtisii TaxID=2051 RepID=UPI00146FDBAC|nr:hypothetical protein [Mobiluncus curtisii]MCU9986658.1 hypothetical protein [Mobiluncus curtisii]MCV0020049.1 hypothetical protein [Mobiluncus curtisii]NMW48943.1 hypothetical protein [Mobiluncus curtisii]NMW89058.1 hypothetical protein [Mobiluncus curtisii]NMX12783.1 hypothetical protein [Mobiluncus curtisii]
MTTLPTIVAAGNLVNGWNKIVGMLDRVLVPLSIVGVIVLVLALVGYLWSKRKGGGNPQLTQGLLITVVIAGICASPKVIIPAFLAIFDILIDVLGRFLHLVA